MFLHIGVEWIVHSEQLLNQRQSYGWTIECGNIHIESSNIEDAIMDFLKFTSELDIVHEHRGYGLVGKVGVFRKTIDNHGYFY